MTPARKKLDPELSAPDEPNEPKPTLLEVVEALGKPAGVVTVSELTALPVADVTTILDELVTAGKLVLGDDQLYRLSSASVPDPDPVADLDLEIVYDDTPTRAVGIPTSDLIRFLESLNLPPQMIEGLGAVSAAEGVLEYRPSVPTADDPHPSREFRVAISGRHTCHSAPSNYPTTLS